MSTAEGFVGFRLVEARKARGITAIGLAEIIGVSAQSLSKYENGHQKPRLDTVDKLVTVLGFPKQYFFRQNPTDDASPVFWRAKLTAPQVAVDRSAVRLEWLKEIVDYLGQFLDFPPLSLLDFEVPDNPNDISLEFIEQAAKALRIHWNVSRGPMPNILEKVESSGILVSQMHVYAEKVDAFSQWSKRFGIPFIMLSHDKSSASRQRFDLLHELAHIILHKKVDNIQLNSNATYKLVEKQADAFASFVLLPEKDFLDELYAPTLDSLVSLKERWGTSIAAMIMRLSHLGLLDEFSTKKIWMNYTRRGWRKGEPYDDRLEKEKPYLLRRSFEMLLEAGVQTVEDIKNSLPFPVEDLEELACLPAGTLGGQNKSRPEPILKNLGSNVVSIFGYEK